MADQTVRVRLEANVSSYMAAMGQAALATKQVSREISGAGKTGKTELNQLGTGAMVAGGAMLAGFGLAIGASANFEAVLSDLGATTGATAAEMELLRQQALDAGQATVFSATEAATAQTLLSKAGLSTADILGGGLTGALDLAAAGQLDLEKATQITSTTMGAFKLQGGDVVRIADALAAGANKSEADVEGLGLSLQQTALVADQLGISMEASVGTLAMFAHAGLRGSDAGTSMKTMLQRFNPVSDEAAGLMEELNIQFFDAQGNFVGLEAAAGSLQAGMSGLTQEQRASAMQTIFGQDAIRAATILYEGGAPGVAEWTAKVSDAGYASELAAAKTDNLKGDVEQLGGAIETSLIQGGTQANGVLRFLTQSTTDVVSGIGSMPGPLAAVAMGFTGVTGTGLLTIGMLGTLAPKVREGLSTLESMGPAGERAASGISKSAKAAGAGAVAVAGLTLAWSMWNAEREKSKSAAERAIDLIETTGVEQARRQIEEARKQVALIDEEIANSSRDAFWDADKRADLSMMRNELVGWGNDMMVVADQADALAAATGGNADEILVWLDGQREAGNVFGSNEEALEAYQAALATGAVGLNDVSVETKIAERATEDFEDAVKALIGTQIEAFDTETDFAGALADLTDELLKNGTTLDLNTEAGRKNRDALSAAAQGALDHAVAVANETGSIQAGNDVLAAHVLQLLAVLGQLGLNRDEAMAYIAQLGLTPETLTTLVNLDTGQANAKLDELQRKARDIFASLNPFGGGPAPGKALGGDAPPHSITEVNERGVEMFTMGGKDYLMTGASGGKVTPHAQTMAALGGGTTTIVKKFDVTLSAPNYMGNERDLVRVFTPAIREEIRRLERSTAGRD